MKKGAKFDIYDYNLQVGIFYLLAVVVFLLIIFGLKLFVL